MQCEDQPGVDWDAICIYATRRTAPELLVDLAKMMANSAPARAEEYVRFACGSCDDPSVLYRGGHVMVQLGRFVDAAKLFVRSDKILSHPVARFWQAKALALAGRFHAAENQLVALDADRPGNQGVIQLLIKLLVLQRKSRKAAQLADRHPWLFHAKKLRPFILAEPSLAKTLLQKGESLERAHRQHQSEIRSIKSDPVDLDTVRRLLL